MFIFYNNTDIGSNLVDAFKRNSNNNNNLMFFDFRQNCRVANIILLGKKITVDKELFIKHSL